MPGGSPGGILAALPLAAIARASRPFTLRYAALYLAACAPAAIFVTLLSTGVIGKPYEPQFDQIAAQIGDATGRDMSETPLALSAVTLAFGAALYAGRRRVLYVAARLEIRSIWGPRHWYDYILAGINRLARVQTRILQNGYLRLYLMIIVTATIGLAGSKVFKAARVTGLVADFDARFYEWMVAGFMLIGALVAVVSQSRLSAVAALGVVGYSVGLIFVLFGAPDLAIWFVRSRREVEGRMPEVSGAMGQGLWVAWPKKASGIVTDVTEDVIRAAGLANGMVDYKVCAIDATWSGLKFARRRGPTGFARSSKTRRPAR